MELGELRFAQGFDATEILKEYEILGGVLFAFALRRRGGSERQATPATCWCAATALFRAISVIEQVTTRSTCASWASGSASARSGCGASAA
jgi:hypothetical protein